MNWLDEVNKLKKENPDAIIYFEVCAGDFDLYRWSCEVTSKAKVAIEELTLYDNKYVEIEDLRAMLIDEIYTGEDDDKFKIRLDAEVAKYKFDTAIVVRVG